VGARGWGGVCWGGGESRGGRGRWVEDGLVRERSRRGVEVDRGVVSPGLSGTTTTTEHHGGGAAPAHCLLADRVGGVAKGREHMVLRVIWWGSCELAECAERWRRQVGRRRRISVWPSSRGGEWHVCLARRGA